MTVNAPATASFGTTAPIELTFDGLGSRRWLGTVSYSGGPSFSTLRTVVRVDKP
jgi:hypothetical protein